MSNEIVLWSFLNAKGRMVKAGDPAPDEGADNLAKYRDQGLIGPAPTEKVEKPKRKPAGKKADK